MQTWINMKTQHLAHATSVTVECSKPMQAVPYPTLPCPACGWWFMSSTVAVGNLPVRSILKEVLQVIDWLVLNLFCSLFWLPNRLSWISDWMHSIKFCLIELNIRSTARWSGLNYILFWGTKSGKHEPMKRYTNLCWGLIQHLWFSENSNQEKLGRWNCCCNLVSEGLTSAWVKCCCIPVPATNACTNLVTYAVW